MDKSIFRQKSLDRISSPEKINEYLHVTNPPVWIVLGAVIVLLAGLCVWGLFGQLDTTIETGGLCNNGVLYMYIEENDYSKVELKDCVVVNGNEYPLVSIAEEPVPLDTDQIDSYLQHLFNLEEDSWVYLLEADATEQANGSPALEVGIYSVSIVTERLKPFDFIFN